MKVDEFKGKDGRTSHSYRITFRSNERFVRMNMSLSTQMGDLNSMFLSINQ